MLMMKLLLFIMVIFEIFDDIGTSNSATVCDVQGLVAARKSEWNNCVLICPSNSKCLENNCQYKMLKVGCSRCVPNDFVVPGVCCKKRIDRIISDLDNRWNSCLYDGCLYSCRGQCMYKRDQCDATKPSLLCIPADN